MGDAFVFWFCRGTGAFVLILASPFAFAFDDPGDPFAKVLSGDPGPWIPALILFGILYFLWVLPMYLVNQMVRADEAPFWNLLAAVGGPLAFLGHKIVNTNFSFKLPSRKKQVIQVVDEEGEALELMGSNGEPLAMSAVKKGDRGYLGVVGDILRRAITERSTDVHFEPTEKGLRVRFRVDGVLHDHRMFPTSDGKGMVSCLKVLSSIDVAEKRKAQDGSFRARRVGEEYDLRAASSSSVYGEKIVVRILPRKPKDISVDKLGIGEDHLKQLRKLVQKPNGMLIVTGPTGSGKTTTLYALMKELDVTRKNIITVEDPVEYHLHGITQIQVQRKAGVTFTSSLESILRQDPDVLMIGEVRDMETAEMAMRASLTGHLVLTTLHTNDAPQTVVRLLNMGIEAYLISTAVKGVISQRLVRKLCTECRSQESADQEESELFQLVGGCQGRIWRAVGCDRCRHTGYFGRTGIFEVLVVDEDVSRVITAEPSLQALMEVARSKNMKSMKEDGLGKALLGNTSADEVLRVVD